MTTFFVFLLARCDFRAELLLLLPLLSAINDSSSSLSSLLLDRRIFFLRTARPLGFLNVDLFDALSVGVDIPSILKTSLIFSSISVMTAYVMNKKKTSVKLHKNRFDRFKVQITTFIKIFKKFNK